jgi:lysophospholipase L1-like esterase
MKEAMGGRSRFRFKEIVVFGDSVAYGAWDEEGGWVQRLRKYYDVALLSGGDSFAVVYNLGVADETTEELLKRFDTEMKSRIWQDEQDLLIVFEIGKNDSSVVLKDGSNLVDGARFTANMHELISQAKKYTNNVLVLGTAPVDEKNLDTFIKDENYAMTNDQIKRYSLILEKVCKEDGVDFIDLFSTFSKALKHSPDKFHFGGMHPNTLGHRRIFALVRAYVERKRF